MIRNLKLKKFLIDRVFPFFTVINNIIPKDKNRILIYSANDRLRDNSGAILDYLIKNKYYNKYKIICASQNYDEYTSPDKKRVIFIRKSGGIYQYIRSKYVFYSFGQIPIKPTTKQNVIYTTHGIPLKKTVEVKKMDLFFSRMTITSEFFKEKIAEVYQCPKEKICICGEPKTDKMFVYSKNEDNIKLIIWTPTFRQSDYLGYDDSHMSSLLPFFGDKDWKSLNNVLLSKKVKIIAKLHPAQNTNGFSKAIYSNLEVYSDNSFRRSGLDLYELLGKSNALIADYSSVYLEYLLLNRPIGFAMADYDDYKNTRGFILGDQIKYMPGKKIYNREDMYRYIDDIANGVDEFTEERKYVRELFHDYKDGNNCERILEIAGIKL